MINSEINFLKFNNPTQGQLLFAEVLVEVVKFMRADQRAKYTIMIGSDSTGLKELDVVSVIAVHRIGNGGRYFWYRQAKDNVHNLRQKIYAEVVASLELASLFLPAFKNIVKDESDLSEMPYDFQIHVDVGNVGPTRDLIHEVTGMVTGYGYQVLVKPNSAAATSLADKHAR